MTDREKLVDMLDFMIQPGEKTLGDIADHFIANGVVVQKHGRWAYIGGDEWCCTNCGYVGSTEGRWEPMLDKFCSECGAKMDLE